MFVSFLTLGLPNRQIFRDSLGERIEVADVAKKLADTKRLGKKNNKGFYLYDERGMFQMVNEATQALLGEQIVNTSGEVDIAKIMGTGLPPL